MSLLKYLLIPIVIGIFVAGCATTTRVQSPIVVEQNKVAAAADAVVVRRSDSANYLRPEANQLVEMPGLENQRIAKFRDLENGCTIYLTTSGGIAVVK